MTKKKTKPKFVPVNFYYMSGYVFEYDATGKLRKRPVCGPNYRGNFRNKYFKKAKV